MIVENIYGKILLLHPSIYSSEVVVGHQGWQSGRNAPCDPLGPARKNWSTHLSLTTSTLNDLGDLKKQTHFPAEVHMLLTQDLEKLMEDIQKPSRCPLPR